MARTALLVPASAAALPIRSKGLPKPKKHHPGDCQKPPENAGILAVQAFARIAPSMQNALHTAIQPFASPNFSRRIEA